MHTSTSQTLRYVLIVAATVLYSGCGSGGTANRQDRLDDIEASTKIAALFVGAFEQRARPLESMYYLGQASSYVAFCPDGGFITFADKKTGHFTSITDFSSIMFEECAEKFPTFRRSDTGFLTHTLSSLSGFLGEDAAHSGAIVSKGQLRTDYILSEPAETRSGSMTTTISIDTEFKVNKALTTDQAYDTKSGISFIAMEHSSQGKRGAYFAKTQLHSLCVQKSVPFVAGTTEGRLVFGICDAVTGSIEIVAGAERINLEVSQISALRTEGDGRPSQGSIRLKNNFQEVILEFLPTISGLMVAIVAFDGTSIEMSYSNLLEFSKLPL